MSDRRPITEPLVEAEGWPMVRIKAWHATYNAALTGWIARGGVREHHIVHAAWQADATHGQIPRVPT